MTWELTAAYEREIRTRWTRLGTGQEHLYAREDILTLLDEIDQLRAARVRADTRSTQTLGYLRSRADEVEARVARAETAVRRVEALKVWRNEDGHQFVFADDLWAAVAPEIALNLGRPTVEPVPPLAANGADRG